MTDAAPPGEHDELVYAAAGLPKTTNWWGAFVIGLAGTILVTGNRAGDGHRAGRSVGAGDRAHHDQRLPRVPAAGRALGDDARPLRAASPPTRIRPTRTAGRASPSTSTGSRAWAYWLGWFPVAPLNMILASFYIVDRFHLIDRPGSRRSTPRSRGGRSASRSSGCCVLAIPAVRGLRFGTVFATALALLSMIPLTFLAIAWIFNPVLGRLQLAGPLPPHRRQRVLHAAVRARLADAVHRVLVPVDVERDRDGGGCLLHRRDPGPRPRRQDRHEPGRPLRPVHLHDDPGGVHHRARPARSGQRGARRSQDDLRHTTPPPCSGPAPARASSNWLIAIMLILALILSALNAITGTARSLHQMSTDGQFPQLLPARQPPWRAQPLDVRSTSACSIAGRVHGRRGRDLHVLERRLPGLVHPGARRLLPAAQAPPERAPAVQAARVDEVRRARDRGRVRDHLLLRRPGVREPARATPPGARRSPTTSSAGPCCCSYLLFYCLPQAGRGPAPGARCEEWSARRPLRSRARPTRELDRATRGPLLDASRAGSVRADPARLRGASDSGGGDPAGPRAGAARRRQRARVLDRAGARRLVRAADSRPAPDQEGMGRAAQDRRPGGQAPRAQRHRRRRPRGRHAEVDQADPPRRRSSPAATRS